MNSSKIPRCSARLYICLFLLAALNCPLPGYGADERTVTSIARISCSDWQKAMEEKNAVSATPYQNYSANVYQYWVLGFMSGYNAAYPTNKDLLSKIDAGTIAVWMDKYCKNNPRSNLHRGAVKLFEELDKISR